MPERILWNRLRGGQLNGLKFRRQQPIGPFTVDFYCHQARLVVELDGMGHDRNEDETRDRWLEGRDFNLRFSVSGFMRARADVIARIGAEAMKRIASRTEGTKNEQRK